MSTRIIVSDMGNQSTEANQAFIDFIEDNIKILQISDRPFVISSKEGIPPTLFKKEEEGDIWVAFISEFKGI